MAAVPFIQMDAAGKFSINESAFNIVQKIKGKLAVVIVAGPYRTGKSYLLNRYCFAKQLMYHSFKGSLISLTGSLVFKVLSVT